jgi:hypothetical protein
MIIGIAGLIGSGKDTAADYLCTFHGFKRMSFASALKETVSVIFGWEYELLEGSTKASREWREEVDTWWAERLGIPNLTPRWVLQQWGTDVARKNFHNDIWVASVENRLRGIKDDIVITDCRFANEITAIKNAGGITLRTHRGEDPDWLPMAETFNTTDNEYRKEYLQRMLENDFRIHASEYSSVGLDYDYYIDNNKTITELHEQIENVLRQSTV